MAIPTSSPIRPAGYPPVHHRAPNVVADSEPESGALQIVDFFQATPELVNPPMAGSFPAVPPRLARLPHGIEVTDAALGTGYQGPIQTTQNPLAPNYYTLSLTAPDQSAETVLANLDQITVYDSGAAILAATQNLQDSAESGVSQTVTNFSWGASSADTVAKIYQNLRSGWTPSIDGESAEPSAVLKNLAGAFDIPLADLTSPDSLVSGPARQQLQQQLIDRVEGANGSEMLQGAQADLRQSVEAYEANHNSLVVAAGNQGYLLELMQEDNGGLPLRTGPDFFTSVLAVPDATVVGALEGRADGSVGVAHYTSPSSTVDVNAWGYLNQVSQGTSFAAPRVAAVMQQLHVQNPGATSSEVEQMMMDRLFQGTPSEPPGAVAEYMNGQTW